MTSFLFFRHETAYELRISDWSSDVCSSDLGVYLALQKVYFRRTQFFMELQVVVPEIDEVAKNASAIHAVLRLQFSDRDAFQIWRPNLNPRHCYPPPTATCIVRCARRSEEHTSELQSLMRISYAVFCLKKKKHPLM